MKKLLIIFLLISCKPNAQTDLSTLDHMAWSQDLEFLVSKINNRFAGFTPALKEKFNSETNKIRAELPHLSTCLLYTSRSRVYFPGVFPYNQYRISEGIVCQQARYAG